MKSCDFETKEDTSFKGWRFGYISIIRKKNKGNLCLL